jgi:hypothetical protein
MADTFDQYGCTLRGRCLHLGFLRVIWFKEYRSSVRVATCYTTPPKKIYMRILTQHIYSHSADHAINIPGELLTS